MNVENTADDLMALDIEYRLTIAARIADDDLDCARYFISRREVLVPEVLKDANARGVDSVDHFAAFARRVHARHESGLSFATEVH